MSDPTKSDLIALLKNGFAGWLQKPNSAIKLDVLTEPQIAALYRALAHEQTDSFNFEQRDALYQDFKQFNLSFNALLSDILSSRLPIDGLLANNNSQFFDRDENTEATEQAILQAKGYVNSAHSLSSIDLTKIQAEMANCTFINRGIFNQELSGVEIQEKIKNGSIKKYLGKNGDTFWAKDLNELCQKEYFQKLAFDPYILSTVAKYLGCCPIHVQTNLWFSFPTFQESNNLSSNAQLFHQDKEFVKFIKVFIYLSDVGDDNGPHCYIESSHIDEAHTFGVAFSSRIPDNEITQYYDANRIKKLIGPAGTIAFGDTSCVHKGLPVKTGYRAMLQLEYASSLHLSPVQPFASLPKAALAANLPYSPQIVARITANYNNENRAKYLQIVAANRAPEPTLLRKLLRLGKRYAKGLK